LFWYTSAVKRVLSNPLYTGNLAQGRYKSNFLKNNGNTETNENEWIIFEDAHPSIITEETFNAVRQMRESRKNIFAWDITNPTQNIFRGLIICGDCGKHMARQRRREKFAFECYVYKSIDRQACTKKAIKEFDLHVALYAYIKNEINLAVDMSRIISDLQKRKSYQHQQNTIEKQIEALKIKLEQNRRFRSSLREDLKDGTLTAQDYTTMKADYDEEKDRLQKKLDTLVAEKTTQDETISPDNKWISEFRRFKGEQQLSAGMVSALIERIKVYEDARIEVTLRYRDDLKSLQEYVRDFEMKARTVNA